MSTLVIDLETLPLASALAAPYPESERPHPQNYKAPEAIAGWREKDRAAWQEQRVKECSLTPRLGRIACIGVAEDDKDVMVLSSATEDGERAMLTRAWDYVLSASRIVGFNSSFDLRFLVIRSIANGITFDNMERGKVRDWFKRYTTYPHFDCRAVLTGWDDRQSGKLHEWCATFGIPVGDMTSGADVYAFAQMGQWDKIAAHCKSDIELTRELYRRVSPLFA